MFVGQNKSMTKYLGYLPCKALFVIFSFIQIFALFSLNSGCAHLLEWPFTIPAVKTRTSELFQIFLTQFSRKRGTQKCQQNKVVNRTTICISETKEMEQKKHFFTFPSRNKAVVMLGTIRKLRKSRYSWLQQNEWFDII